MLPNRNSLAYEALYGIDGAATIFRGTIRYAGFAAAMLGLQRSGLLRDVPARPAAGPAAPPPATWAEVELLAPLTGPAAAAAEHLGLVGPGAVPLANPESLLDSICKAMEDRLLYGPGERDMVLMRHEVRAVMPDGTIETRTSSLRVLGGSTGEAEDTAMGRTVGITAGVCARLVLEGRLAGRTGVATPVTEDVYGPALALLAREGLEFHEESSVLPPGHHHTE